MPLGALSCPICYCEYNQEDQLPRVMPNCGHTVCSKCLLVLLENTDSAKCPLDNHRFLSQQSTLEAFPINFIVRQLSEEKATRRSCSIHGEKLRLVCLTDKTQICDECVFSGDHKGHEIKSLKKFQQEALHKRKELEVMSREIERHHSEIKEMLEERRMSLLQVIRDKFQGLRWLLAKKELELSFEVNSFFDVEMEKLMQGNKDLANPVNGIIKSLTDIGITASSQDFIEGMEQDISEIASKIGPEIFDKQAQSLSMKFNKLSNNFYDQLVSQIECFSRLEFRAENLSIEACLENELQKDLPIISDHLVIKRIQKTLKLEVKDDWLVITAANPSDHANTSSNLIDMEWKELDKVWLKLGKCANMIECFQALMYIWQKLSLVTCVKVDFSSKDISDRELSYLFSMIYFRAAELHAISVDLCDCKVSDQSLAPFLSEILPCIIRLKSVALNLNSTQITDKTVELFAKNVNPALKVLESFDLRLWETKVTDRSIVQLFSKMERVKRFVLDLGYTGVTNESITTLAHITLPSMKVLEEFKLGLSKTSVTDESVNQIFINMETAKHFLLYLHGTNITDKSLEMFARKTLPSLRAIEVFEMRLGETKVSDQSVIKLFNNMESVRKFVLKLQSTNITDRTVETFMRVTFPTMRVLEQFEMDVSNTEVSEKCSSQLTRIKEKLSEQFISL